jgi:pyruvate carboxylase
MADVKDLEELRAAKDAAGSDVEDVFEDGMAPKEAKTVHHVRANSTIMHLKKLLVANRGEIPIRIFRTAHELSLHTIAIFSYEDRLSMHRQSTYTSPRNKNGGRIGECATV